jgi:NADH-quinone oxidoreductase subunit J
LDLMALYKGLKNREFSILSDAAPTKVGMNAILFYVLAGLAVLSALNVIIQKKTMYAAISLVACFGSISGIYFLLGAPFIGSIQLIIYAGAIMVLFVIVIMLLDPFSEVTLRNESRLWVGLAILLGAGLFAILYSAIHAFRVIPPSAPAAAGAAAGNTEALAALLFQKYLLPFEAVSILILVAIIGAVILAKKRRTERS